MCFPMPFKFTLMSRVLIGDEPRMQHIRLCTMDVRAVNHILTHSLDYQKPEMGRKNLAKLIGEGARHYMHSYCVAGLEN